MLYNLEPSADLTGGPWYNDQKELDVTFVNDLLGIVYRVVDKRSFPPPLKIQTDDGVKKVQTFYQPTYRGYATAEDVYEFIIKSKVLDDSIKDTFGVSHVHKLLEVLCYNNQIQKRTDGETYRSILSDDDIVPPEQEDVYYDNDMFERDQADLLLGHKGYTEAPCGRCPVFAICGVPGEDVSAANCKYWDEWTSRVTPAEFF
jgi:DNA-directed RNA polymerase III subunit RPC6